MSSYFIVDPDWIENALGFTMFISKVDWIHEEVDSVEDWFLISEKERPMYDDYPEITLWAFVANIFDSLLLTLFCDTWKRRSHRNQRVSQWYKLCGSNLYGVPNAGTPLHFPAIDDSLLYRISLCRGYS